MDAIDKNAVRKLIDRQDILDCLTRYSRGVDRLDKELLLSAYHPDARDDHGVFVGDAADFWNWVHNAHGTGQKRTFHTIANHSCEIDGDVAHAETYCLYFGLNQDDSLDVVGNRYVDRLERRDGAWRIADRVCVVDWYGALNDSRSTHPTIRAAMADLMSNAPTGRDRSDISYLRPLRHSRPSRMPDLIG